MLYANERKLTDIEYAIRELLKDEKTVAIAVEYLDTDKPRDDELLKSVKRCEPQGPKQYAFISMFGDAVKRNILRWRDDELTDRFLLFSYACCGCYFLYMSYEIFARLGKEKVMKTLSLWFGDDADAAMNGALIAYCGDAYKEAELLKAYRGEYKGDNASADLFVRTVKYCGQNAEYVLKCCMIAVEFIKDGEHPEYLDVIIDTVMSYTKNITANTPGFDYICLALAVISRFTDKGEEFFKKYIKGASYSVALLANRILKNYEYVYDILDRTPEAVSPGYILYFESGRNVSEEQRQKHFKYFAKNYKEMFIDVMKNKAAVTTAVEMDKILTETDENYVSCYEELREISQKKTSELITSMFPDIAEDVRKYLLGKESFSEVTALLPTKVGHVRYVRSNDYYSAFGNDEFIARCVAFMHATNVYHAVYYGKCASTTGFMFEKHVKTGVEMFVSAQVPFDMIFKIMDKNYSFLYGDNAEQFMKNCAEALVEYSDEIIKCELKKLPANARYIYVSTLAKNKTKYKEEIFAACDETGNAVKKLLCDIISDEKDWKDDIITLLKAKKAAKRELAINIITRQGVSEYKEEIEKAAETEKSEKLKTKLLSLLLDGHEKGKSESSVNDMIDGLTKGNKTSKLNWLFEMPFAPVHTTEGEEADEKILRAMILSYADMFSPNISQTAMQIEKMLDKKDVEAFAMDVFGRWFACGAQAKTKWVMYFSVIHGGDELVGELTKIIKEWAENMRGAIAAEAVGAMALNGSQKALMNVDNMSRKFKQKQVKAAAVAALDNAAEQLNITAQELADRIVPDMGFDENMCRVFDYGSRKFNVYITPSLEIEIYNGEKKVKNMPKPGVNDDASIADKAYADFKEMKKQMKTVVESQKQRLEYVLMCDRKWTKEGWEKLFVKNPVMHCFAIGLIWGIYENGELKTSFRYMDDGSFTTADEDEFEPAENAVIGLVHPIELSEEEKNTWTEQLSDYEITQPFAQLSRTVFNMEEDELEAKEITRFSGAATTALTLIGKMTKFGWYKGEAMDAGFFESFKREDVSGRIENGKKDGIYAELGFSGAYIAAGYGYGDEDVTVGELKFRKSGETEWLAGKDVNKRYFSEIILQLSFLGQ